MRSNQYIDGEYLKKNPDWHAEDSSKKAEQIKNILEKNGIYGQKFCEVGCGAGEIIRSLHAKMDNKCNFHGFEISPQAYEICKSKATERLKYSHSNIMEDNNYYDILLCIDVFEHIEDYFSFLRAIKDKAAYKVFRIPLDITIFRAYKKNSFLSIRKSLGHIHYFNYETALETLKDTGYEIIDSYYVSPVRSHKIRSVKAYLYTVMADITYWLNKDISVRLFGLRSLIVVAR